MGVRKLIETNEVVDGLRSELVKLGPVLKAKAIETETLLAQVAKDSAEANIVAKKVGAEEAIVGKQAAETQVCIFSRYENISRWRFFLYHSPTFLYCLVKECVVHA